MGRSAQEALMTVDLISVEGERVSSERERCT